MGDLDAVHRLLDVDVTEEESGAAAAAARAEREHWLRWTILGYETLARLHQPPHGDRAIILKQTDLGMRIERNRYPSPPWLQVVGILYHPRLA
jgi:hypothetical protein